jgi:hypothetical protein
VFKIKLKELINNIHKKHILGRTITRIYVIEFQKRGLPHAHIFIFFFEDCKPHTIEDVDRMISAELSNPETNKLAHKTIARCMMHCRNPGFRLATKAKGLQECGPRGSPGVTSHTPGSVRKCEGVNPHTPKATPTLGDGVPVDS